jgi:hypothetical protein
MNIRMISRIGCRGIRIFFYGGEHVEAGRAQAAGKPPATGKEINCR